MSLEQLDVLENESQVYGKQKTVGCCSLYRECSLEGKCISPFEEIKQECIYRVHLEAGRIFYSKNACSFSVQKYDEVVGKYNQLNGELKQYFDNILYYFLRYNALSEYALFLRNDKLDALVENGFLAANMALKSTVLDFFRLQYIKSLLSEDVKITKKEKLIEHIIENDAAAIERLYQKYIYVRFDIKLFTYYQELYIDNNINIASENFINHFLPTILPLEEDILKN